MSWKKPHGVGDLCRWLTIARARGPASDWDVHGGVPMDSILVTGCWVYLSKGIQIPAANNDWE